ncbi:hypothetical protein [Escherichia coli]|uniref:hypothetical protein n=1 Tax=Escherichia coli TaxID=562 RepID=UPI0020405402|nr:hypothetical protein [Escherichia coli]
MNIKDISFVIQKGIFCELHIRGIEGHVMAEDDFSEVYRKIKEISPRVNNTGEGVSEGSGCASGAYPLREGTKSSGTAGSTKQKAPS